MDLILLKRVNRLWHHIYPYLAKQITGLYPRDTGTVLELGPFSLGISMALAEKLPGLSITIADDSPEVLDYFMEEMKSIGFSDGIRLEKSPMDNLDFSDSQFDLVVCRGAFFFLDENGRMLREIFRVLQKDGIAFVGGGFGEGTPPELIQEISDESRDLNDRLGRKRVRVAELAEMIRQADLSAYCRIIEKGGLWVVIKKGGNA